MEKNPGPVNSSEISEIDTATIATRRQTLAEFRTAVLARETEILESRIDSSTADERLRIERAKTTIDEYERALRLRELHLVWTARGTALGNLERERNELIDNSIYSGLEAKQEKIDQAVAGDTADLALFTGDELRITRTAYDEARTAARTN